MSQYGKLPFHFVLLIGLQALKLTESRAGKA